MRTICRTLLAGGTLALGMASFGMASIRRDGSITLDRADTAQHPCKAVGWIQFPGWHGL